MDARAIADRDGVTEITTRLRHGGIIDAIGEIEGEARVIFIGKRGEAANCAKSQGLADASAVLAGAGIGAEPRIVPGQKDVELGKLVEGIAFGMLVIGANSRSLIRSLVINSTTTEKMPSSKAPVLLLRSAP